MCRVGLVALAGFLVGCAPTVVVPRQPPEEHVTYYDRNHDGLVDYELHVYGSGHFDQDWALVDTKFRGRYDLRVGWSIVIKKDPADAAIPKNVKITPGGPPKDYTY
jgi:hypothetical protein